MQLKTILGFIITIFLTTSNLLYSDSTSAVIDSTISEIKSQLNVGEDNFDTHFTFNSDIPPQKWWNMPFVITLFGSFLAAAVAISVMFWTNSLNKKATKYKQDVKYMSLLFGIYSEVKTNDRIIDLLIGVPEIENTGNKPDDSRGEIEIYIDAVKEQPKLINADVFNTLKVKFIEQCRLNMIENESFSLAVLEITSRYIDKANAINYNLKSEKIMQLQNHLKDGDSLYDAVKIYLDSVTDDLNNLKTGGIELRKIILIDRKNFSNVDIQFEDTSLEIENKEEEKK